MLELSCAACQCGDCGRKGDLKKSEKKKKKKKKANARPTVTGRAPSIVHGCAGHDFWGEYVTRH